MDITDIGWFAPDGAEMTEEHWGEGFAKSMAVFLNGDAIPNLDARGERITDKSFYLLFNAHHEPIPFTLPEPRWGQKWKKILATNEVKFADQEEVFSAGDRVTVDARSLVLLVKEE
jgi:glycogen operon protein